MPAVVRSDRNAWRTAVGAFVYFLLVMVSGFLFGAVRELVFVPKFGREIGELLELPFMLAAIVANAWFATSWLHVPADLVSRIIMGVLSIALVLAAELGLSPFVRGSVQAWLDSFTPITLTLAMLLWAAHAIMPALIGRNPIGSSHSHASNPPD